MIRMLSENGGTTRVEPLITKGAFFTDAGFSFLFRSPELALIATRNSRGTPAPKSCRPG
jgi:hypothetical protein